MNRGQISNTLRKLRLLYPLDSLRYRVQKAKNDSDNRAFKTLHPNLVLPPDYLMYESFQINYHKYYYGGKDTAEWVIQNIGKYKDVSGINILDWGCGPGRIIRHLPKILSDDSKIYGTDYNEASINWCKANIQQVEFNHNDLEAKLPYRDDFFDAIYGISIFTHLSRDMHFSWFKELTRILKPGGIIFVTTQGENFRKKLSKHEIEEFDNGELVVRGQVKEGHRTFSAFHPDQFLKSLFGDHTQVLEKIVTTAKNESYTPQDAWVIQKN